jgi:hypothetical protein
VEEDAEDLEDEADEEAEEETEKEGSEEDEEADGEVDAVDVTTRKKKRAALGSPSPNSVVSSRKSASRSSRRSICSPCQSRSTKSLTSS